MKLTLFGSTGPLGQTLINQALDAGHEVKVYVRNPGKLNIKHDRLTIATGELTDAAAIEAAIQSSDAVLSALGPIAGSKGTALSNGVKNIVAAMNKLGLRRLIFISTPSVRDVNDKGSFKVAYLRWVVKTIFRNAYDEIRAMGEAVRGSNLDWTLVRVQLLTNKPVSGRVIAGYVGDGKVKTFIARGNIAKFMLEQLGNPQFVRKAPVISDE